MFTLLALVSVGIAPLSNAQALAPLGPPRPFLKARGSDLYLGTAKFRNVGANLPDLFERFLLGEDTDAIASLQRARDTGIRAARCWGTTWGPDRFGLFESDRLRWLSAFDRMLDAANRCGIGVIPSLLFNPRMIPQYVSSKTGGEEGLADLMTPGARSNDLAIAYVTEIVSRFRHDSRVLFWEIGNEYNLEADLSLELKDRLPRDVVSSTQVRAFLAQMASLIKRLDRNHLVASGNADMRPAAWRLRRAMLRSKGAPDERRFAMDWTHDTRSQYEEMLAYFNPPPLDLICVHQYPLGRERPSWLSGDDSAASMLPWTSSAAAKLGKPLFIGEFAQKAWEGGSEQAAPWLEDLLRRIRSGAAPLALVWSWEFNPNAPDQAAYSLSAERTPRAVRLISEANRALRDLR